MRAGRSDAVPQEYQVHREAEQPNGQQRLERHDSIDHVLPAPDGADVERDKRRKQDGEPGCVARRSQFAPTRLRPSVMRSRQEYIRS